MTSQLPLRTRLKRSLEALLAKLRALATVPPRPQLQPIRARPSAPRTNKELERWRNEGGH